MSALSQKQVLMLCYYYPPIQTSGTIRSKAFTDLLPKHGWNPIVLSPKNSKDRWVKHEETRQKEEKTYRSMEWDLTKLVDTLHGVTSKVFSIFGVDIQTNYFREILCIPDPQIAWCSTFRGFFLAQNANCIYATCSPFSSALSGVFIKLLTKKPLVLDFRDAWTLNPHVRHTAYHTFFSRILENFCLRIADKIILNTPGTEKLYRKHFSFAAEKMLCIPNGYDTLPPSLPGSLQTKRFTIVHIGNFYLNRSPNLLLEALVALKEEGIEIDIEFIQVGNKFTIPEHLQGRVKIQFTGNLPRAEALELMQTASLLYLKQGFEPGVTDYIAVAAKTYEYLSSGIPILADCPEGDNTELIRKYGKHSLIATKNNRNELKEILSTAISQKANIQPYVSEEFKQLYEREALTKKLAQTLDSVST